VVGYKKGTNEKLAKIIEPYSYRVQFRPKVPSTYSIREVEMTKEQAKAYAEIKQFATTQISKTAYVTASAVISQILRMHQILCGHVQDEEGNEHEIPENRTQALIDELEDYSGKAVIWFTYVQDLIRCRRRLEKEYGVKSTASFYGGNADDREIDEEAFKNDPACRFMVATAGAGGRGRTWSVADRIIYFSNSDNLEHREQSEQRGLGVEKTRGVDYVDLVVPGTVDMKILEALRAKINMATAINGDNYREWLI
jgi:SNF2 family DNA or RNA helicase